MESRTTGLRIHLFSGRLLERVNFLQAFSHRVVLVALANMDSAKCRLISLLQKKIEISSKYMFVLIKIVQ